jgi:hypothetical protein
VAQDRRLFDVLSDDGGDWSSVHALPYLSTLSKAAGCWTPVLGFDAETLLQVRDRDQVTNVIRRPEPDKPQLARRLALCPPILHPVGTVLHAHRILALAAGG